MLRSQSLLAALIACLVLILSSTTSHVSAEGVRVRGRERYTSASRKQQRVSRASSKIPVPERKLGMSKSGMSMSKSSMSMSKSMMSKSVMSRSGSMMSMRMKMMMMGMMAGNSTRATDFDIDDIEDLFVGLGLNETFDTPLEALEAFGLDEIRVDGLRTFPIASRIVFEFFPGTGREPTIGEVAVVEDATVRFFKNEFKDNDRFGPVFEDFDISQVQTTYREEAVPDKFTLEFVAVVTVDSDSDEYSPRRTNARSALNVMSRSDFKEFIGDYVRQSGGIWNEFSNTHAVRFKGVGRNDS